MSDPAPLRVLLLEDQPADAELAARELRRGGLEAEIRHVETLPAFEAALGQFCPDVVISDYNLQGFDGLEALHLVRERNPLVPFIFLSGSIGEERAVEALRRGASDYVMKDRMGRLPAAVLHAVSLARSEVQAALANEALRRSEERFRLVALSTNDGIWDFDLRQGRAWLSEKLRTLFGYGSEAEYATEEWWLERIHPDDLDAVLRDYEQYRSGTRKTLEYRFRRADGTFAEVVERAELVRDPSGQPVRLIGSVQDVTSQKASERALQASELRFRSMAETSKDALLLVDEGGIITFANPAVKTIFGWDPWQVVGAPLSTFAPPGYERDGDLMAMLRARIGSREVLQIRARRSDGSMGHFEVSVSSWRAGEETSFALTARDVSDRYRRQQRDRLITRLARDLLAGPPEEWERVVVAFLEAAAGTIGYECVVAAFLDPDGTSVADAVEWRAPGADRFPIQPGSPAAELDRLAASSVDPSKGLVAVRPGRGTKVEGLIVTRLPESLLSRRSETHAFLEVVGELTASTLARKRTIDELTCSRGLLAEAQALARIGTCEKDLTTGRLWWSPELLRLFGLDPEAGPTTEQVFSMMDSEDRSRFDKACERAGGQGRPVTMEFRLNRPDRQQAVFEITISPLSSGAGPGHLLGIAQDITRRVALERQVEQGNRIDSLGRLAATIAHEFNNVLMGILPFAELLRRRIENDPKSESAVASILNSVQRGRNITQEILRFTRPSAPVMESIDVREWLGQLADELQQVVGPSIAVRVSTNGAPVIIRGDRLQLTQVVSNLVYNARDAMPRGGVITVTAGLREGLVHVAVVDEGEGIPPHVLPNVFDPLFTTKKSGTGLGLAVVHQIVKRHGGAVHVESTPGQGTAFHLEFPPASR